MRAARKVKWFRAEVWEGKMILRKSALLAGVLSLFLTACAQAGPADYEPPMDQSAMGTQTVILDKTTNAETKTAISRDTQIPEITLTTTPLAIPVLHTET